MSSITPVRGYGQVLVSTPRHWGQVRRHGWGIEHSFPRLSDRLQSGQADDPRIPGLEEWTHDGTTTIPSLRAMTLAPTNEWIDHWPDGCDNEAELSTLFDLPGRADVIYWDAVTGSWTPVAPTGYGFHIWLATAELSYVGNAVIETQGDWDEESSLQVLFWTWSPYGDVTARPFVRFEMGKTALGVGGLAVHYPMVAPGGIGDTETRPIVLTADTDEVLAYLDDPTIGDASAALTPQMRVFTIRAVEPHVYLVSVGMGPEVLIVRDDLALNAGPLRVTVQGGGCAFTVSPIRYELVGTAQKLVPSVWPSWVGRTEVDIRTRHTLVDDLLATTEITTDEHLIQYEDDDYATTQVELTLSTDNAAYTPVVYLVHETHEPELLIEEPAWRDLSEYIPRMTVFETPDGRAAHAQVNIWNRDGVLDSLRENSWCEIAVGHQWCTAPPSTDWAATHTLLSGWLWIDETSRRAAERDESWLTAMVYPWTSRLEPKTMVQHGEMSFAGWPLQELVHMLFEARGVPESMIVWDIPPADLADMEIPCQRKWERRYAYSYDTPFIEAADELLASCGCRWKIARTGEIVVYQPTEWSGIPDWILDDTDPYWVDCVESIQALSDSQTLNDIVMHIGATTEGAISMGLVADADALWNIDHPMFVGDDRWSVRVDYGNPEPGTTAQAEYLRSRRYQRRVTWEWVAHPHWLPGQTVELRIDGIRLPRGTVVEILGKVGDIDADTMDYHESIEAGVIRWPE